eukprot:15327455-Ditylum_brightwellii.AAC.1
MGVSKARANAPIQLQQLHYICTNKRATALAARRHAHDKKWKTTVFSWFAEQERYQYKEWLKFCNEFCPDRGH